MSMRIDGEVIHLEADCRVEEAETLVALLEAHTGATVELGQCRSLHAAVLQVLLQYAPEVSGEPADDFLRDWILPTFASARSPGRSSP